MRNRPECRARTGLAASALLAVSLLSSPAPVLAQSAIERHPPARSENPSTAITIEEQDFGKASESPLGVDLAGVHIIGEDGTVAARPASGITGIAAVGRGRTVDPAAIRSALDSFLGKPLSLALAGKIQAAIARVYKEAGFPFVSVTLPPQEITGGVLQVRVIEFRSGKVSVGGVSDPDAANIRSRIRMTQGDPIDAAALEEDLGWINRSPYRRASGVFKPGEEAALSDLGVEVESEKPWQVFGGWSNSGSSATGRNRYFVGVDAGLSLATAPWISYQLTTSDDVWSDPATIVPSRGDYPSYVSHAGRITIPTFARQSLEIAPAAVLTSEASDPFFVFESATYELPIIYRSAVSNILPGHYWGDIYGGVEFKRLERTTYFSGTEVGAGSADLFQVVLGWSNRFDDPYGRTSIDLRMKVNPGGVLNGNADATWQAFTNGRVSSIDYAYLAADISRVTPLPHRLAWISAISGTLAGRELPDTERISLGGRYAVRGYNYDDVSVDSGVIWRNELRLPSVSILANAPRVTDPSWAPGTDALSPFIFADLGFGVDQATDESFSLGGLGAGFDYTLGSGLTANLTAGIALQDAGKTDAGDLNLQMSVSARF